MPPGYLRQAMLAGRCVGFGISHQLAGRVGATARHGSRDELACGAVLLSAGEVHGVSIAAWAVGLGWRRGCR